MTGKHTILMLAAGVLLAIVSGCSQQQSAQQRWQRTMDQVRLQAAAKSLDEGRLTYAERVLNECGQRSDPASGVAKQVEQLRTRIQVERNRYAKADDQAANPEEMTY